MRQRNDRGRIVNWHRPLRPGQLKARYLRRRSEWSAEDDVDDEPEWWGRWDYDRSYESADSLDALWEELTSEILHAEPFNPLCVGAGRRQPTGAPADGDVLLEEHVLEPKLLERLLLAHFLQLQRPRPSRPRARRDRARPRRR